MKNLSRHFLLLSICIVCSGHCPAQGSKPVAPPPPPPPPAVEYNQSSWKDFFPPDSSFKISMPGKPKYSTQQIDTKGVQIIQHVYLLNTGAAEYAVSYMEFPTLSSDPQIIRRILDAGRDNVLATDTTRKLLSEQEIKIEGYDGRDMVVEDGDSITRSRNFIAGTRAYQIVLWMPRNAVFKTARPSANPADHTEFYETTATKFLNSFRLIPGGRGTITEAVSMPQSPAVESNPDSWKEFSSAEGNFKVSMPGVPSFINQETTTAVGVIQLHMYQVITSNAVYMVMYGDFPVRPEDPNVIKRILEGGRDSMLAKNKDNKLLSDTEVVMGAEVGREWLIEEGDLIIRDRSFFIKGRLYQVILGAKRNVAFKTGQSSLNPQDRTEFYETASSKFLNSFKLLPAASDKSPEVFSWTKTSKGDALVIGNCTGPECQAVKGNLKRGESVSKPQPLYPAIARAARASGTVEVRVIVDEEGKVIDAKAVSGHPLLHAVAVKAAREAVFTPTLLDGKPVKVLGVITYNFMPTK